MSFQKRPPRFSFVRRLLPRFFSRFFRGSRVCRATTACLVASNRFGRYCVPRNSSHRPAAKRILNGMVHEPRTLRFIRDNLGKGDVVHAGTYFGDFIPGIAKKMSAGQLLWAFEPVPENFSCARETVRLNALENVRLFNAGLGKEKAVLPMITIDKEGNTLGGGSRIARKSHAGDVTVDIVPIDAVVPTDRQVGIIQLDVEGQELPALQGAWRTIQRSWPLLILEVWRKNQFLEDRWFQENILASGYEVVGKVHENTVLARPEKEFSRRFLR